MPAGKVEVPTRDFEFNFNCLLNSQGVGERSPIFEVLYQLSHTLRPKKNEFRTLLRRVEESTEADHPHWSPTPEAKLKMKARQASPLDRVKLKDTRETHSSSSMELLSDLLVSSIIDEVTGKAASAAAAESSLPVSSSSRYSSAAGAAQASAADEERRHGVVDVDHPEAACRTRLNGALLETALLQLSSMHYLAGKAMLSMASSRYLDLTVQPSISRFMQGRVPASIRQNCYYSHSHFVQECVKTLTTEGIPEPPVKRRLSEAEIERAFSVVRSNPEQRRKLEHGEEVDEIETDIGKEVKHTALSRNMTDSAVNYRILNYLFPSFCTSGGAWPLESR